MIYPETVPLTPKAAKVYPPKSNADLRTLHQSIVTGSAADHHKLSVLYYILLDCGDVSQSGLDLSVSLQEKYYLPKKYQIMMQGLWHMDNFRFEVSFFGLLRLCGRYLNSSPGSTSIPDIPISDTDIS